MLETWSPNATLLRDGIFLKKYFLFIFREFHESLWCNLIMSILLNSSQLSLIHFPLNFMFFLMTYWVQLVLCENMDMSIISSFRVWTTYQGPHNQRKLTFYSPASVSHQHFFSWGWGIVSSPLIYAGISSDLILRIYHSCCESLCANLGASLTRRHCFPAFLPNL